MKTVFLDVDTQIDFVFPAGALYVPGAERVLPNIARLNRYAMEQGIPLISTADNHAENDSEFLKWPAHCVGGTVGQLKPQSTMVGQTIVEKQHNDVFTARRFEPLLAELGGKRFVVYGVVTEICVRFAAFGLLERGVRVELVTDAIRSLDDAAAAEMLGEFAASGGVLTTVDVLCGAPPAQ
jgi:nicotinamidase/pyrazinamidase